MVDDLDMRIAEALQQDARQSSDELGKKLGISPSTIRRRVSNLIQENVIRIIALTNPVSTGHNVWAMMGLNVKMGTTNRVADALLQFPFCYTISVCLGRFDIIVFARFRSTEDLTEFVTTELAKIDGITSCETSLLTKPRKYFDFVWPAMNSSESRDGKSKDGGKSE